MAVAAPGQLNLYASPAFGSRTVDCFDKLEQIGEGTYGLVYKARDVLTGEIVALKKIRTDKEKEGFPITAMREIKILKKLRHQNVIKLKEIVTSTGPGNDEQGKPGPTDGNKYKGDIYMVFEYMDHDFSELSKRGVRFSVPQIKCYMKQLLTGLHYCHLNEVLHRDIKAANLLVDNEGNLKLADFGLARSLSNDHQGNLTNEVITLWYRPPEILLGATKYGPAIDMWSVGCIFAELLLGKPILPGKDRTMQLEMIFKLCGSPNEVNWPGVSKLPWYKNFKPKEPKESCLRETFRQYGRHAVELLDKMMTLDPSQRISAKDALDAEYFWTDPLPCDPKSLPKYETSHEFKVRQQQRQQEEAAKRQKLQHSHVPPYQQSRYPPLHPGVNQPIHTSQPPVAAGASHHYGKSRGPSGVPSRFNPNRASQGGGGGYNSGSYPHSPQGRGPPYVANGMPGPRGGGSNYSHNSSSYRPHPYSRGSSSGREAPGDNSKSHQQHYYSKHCNGDRG
ncbi:hypothetical protein C5167_029502 [Papaver somniferum]|nr:hypothetical protein C5167_029502 [Papaver somniferum]